MKSLLLIAVIATALTCSLPAAEPFREHEDLFPLESIHNHSSCVIETPEGDLIICWFHGSGERTADDVKVLGARLRKGSRQWSERFVMADTPDYPDTNCTMFVDPEGRLWLIWPTILANQWESALLKYKISSHYRGDGVPKWDIQEVLHVTPGTNFVTKVNDYSAKMEKTPLGMIAKPYLDRVKKLSEDKLSRRLGWMTRAHPQVIDGKRLIVPLYSDGFSFSLMAISDDWGQSWHTSEPLPGPGNIQPSVVRKKDGSLVAYMRDNGPPPKRLHQSESRDRGETWSEVVDSVLPNPGSGSEVIRLANGHWAFIGNDLEKGRHSLAVKISEDEGATWKYTRHLERCEPEGGEFHYPTMIQSKDGFLHASYTYNIKKATSTSGEGSVVGKTIRHAKFNEEWVREGGRPLR